VVPSDARVIWVWNLLISQHKNGMKDCKIWLVNCVWKIVTMMTKNWLFVTSVTKASTYIVSIHHYIQSLNSHFFVRHVQQRNSNKRQECKRNKFNDFVIQRCWSCKIKLEDDNKSPHKSLFHRLMKITIGYLLSWKSNKRKLLVNY